DVRVHADIGGIEHRQQLRVRYPAGERHVGLDAKFSCIRTHCIELGAAAHQPEVHVFPLYDMNDVLDRAQQQINPLLLAHHTDIADQEAPPALQAFVRRLYFQPPQIGPAAHDVNLIGIHAPTLDRNPAVRLIRSDGNVRGPKCHPLEPKQQTMENAATPELRLVKLRIDVVVVEQKALAEGLEHPADKENRVRWIACVDSIEAARK